MALNQKYYNLKNVQVTTLGGLVTIITNLSIKRNPTFIDRTAGPSLTEQRVYNGEKAPEIMMEGFNDDTLSFADLVPNDPIESFTVLSPDDSSASLLQSDFFTKWPVSAMVIGAVDTAWEGENCSKWKVPIEAGILNPNS
jgi:hypothetical protein